MTQGKSRKLGMSEKLFAVPWAALKLDPVNKRSTLDVSKGRLEGAPGIDKDNWPDMADPLWAMGSTHTAAQNPARIDPFATQQIVINSAFPQHESATI